MVIDHAAGAVELYRCVADQLYTPVLLLFLLLVQSPENQDKYAVLLPLSHKWHGSA